MRRFRRLCVLAVVIGCIVARAQTTPVGRISRSQREAMGFVGPVRTVTTRVDISGPAPRPGFQSSTQQTFSMEGMLVEVQSLDADGNLTGRTTYEFKNNIRSRTEATRILRDGEERVVTTYDGKGLPTEIATYNSDGTLRSRETYVRNYATGAEQRTTYDGKGNITADVRHENVHIPGSNRTALTEDGRVILEGELSRSPAGTQSQVIWHNPTSSSGKSVTVADQNGRRTVVSLSSGLTTATASDKTGQITDMIRVEKDGTEIKRSRHYDERHRLVAEDEERNGTVRRNVTVTYTDDDRGNWIKSVSERVLTTGAVQTTVTTRTITYY